MKVFVTGASGYIGSAVATALSAAGHAVHGLVRSKEKAARLEAIEVEPVLGSLDEPESFAAAARAASVLVHCASESSPSAWDLQRAAAESLVAFATANGLPRTLIWTSGVWVYGDTGEGVADEGTALNAPALVAPRPALDEKIVKAGGGTLKTLVIRPGCVYGGSGGMTASWFSSAASEGAARIVGGGEFRWSMVHLHDLADLYIRAAESAFGGEVFNATDRSRFTVRECAEAASRAAGGGGKVVATPLEEARKTLGPFADCLVLNQHVDSSKAVRLLGWQPRHGGFVDGVAHYYAAWKAANS